uniref:Putative capsid protein n=1 Tax=viral metagenome TaxID=1070528 RepID=A0A6H1ZQ23_9ZZZZ
MTLLRANADDLMHVGLDEVLFQKYSERKFIFSEIYDVRGSTKKYEKVSGFSGFGLLVKKNEGSDLTPQDPVQGYDTTFTHVAYGLYARVTKEMQDDDQYDVIKRLPPALSDSVGRTKEYYAAAIFNGMFDTAGGYQSGGDGECLGSTSHPLTGGGTYQNILSTAADLGLGSLEEALYTMRLTVGDQSENLELEPAILLVPPQLERVAWELTQSQGRPDTANRADNWMKTQNLRIIVWNKLTDTDAWFLLTEKSQHNLVFYNRQELDTDSDRDFKSKDFMYSVYTRFSVGWMDWRGVFGTPGA